MKFTFVNLTKTLSIQGGHNFGLKIFMEDQGKFKW